MFFREKNQDIFLAQQLKEILSFFDMLNIVFLPSKSRKLCFNSFIGYHKRLKMQKKKSLIV
jgi:hypothetical protein